MTEFKIGDKVVVITNFRSSTYSHCFKIGDNGTVHDVNVGPNTLSIEVVVNGITQLLHPSELELVNV